MKAASLVEPLRETQIRPDEMRAQQAEHFAADIARLIKRKAEFVEVACPACQSRQSQAEFTKYGLDYRACSQCGTVFISPRPTPEILEDFYTHSQNYEFWNSHIFPASEAVRREKIFRPRADLLEEICRRHRVETNVLLEVGAGFGTFCEEMRGLKVFREIIAVEPTPSLAKTCRERGLNVVESAFETAPLENESADVVAAFEVIEHLFEPRQFVARCHQLLRPNGLLVLTCPNVRGFDIATLGVLSDAVDAEHLNYFHPASLSQLVNSCGFEVLEIQTPGKLDAELVRKKALEGQIPLHDQPFLRQILLDEWETLGAAFQNFLAQNQLSSHLWLVARKIDEN